MMMMKMQENVRQKRNRKRALDDRYKVERGSKREKEEEEGGKQSRSR